MFGVQNEFMRHRQGEVMSDYSLDISPKKLINLSGTFRSHWITKTTGMQPLWIVNVHPSMLQTGPKRLPYDQQVAAGSSHYHVPMFKGNSAKQSVTFASTKCFHSPKGKVRIGRQSINLLLFDHV